MHNEVVSIITPAFNSSHFIRQTIESVQAQTYEHWEAIIVDDCSQDNTCEIVKEKAKKDDRIRLIRLPQNVGPAVSRNTAIEAAKGRYIAFLDCDDIWVPEKLEKQLDFMEKNESAFSYTAYETINEYGTVMGKKIGVPEIIDYRGLLLTCVIGCLTVIYDTRKIGKLYMPDIPKGQDYALWLKILKKCSFAHGLNERLALYRVRSSSISRNKLAKAKYQWKIYRDIEKLPLFKSIYYFFNYAYHGFIKNYL